MTHPFLLAHAHTNTHTPLLQNSDTSILVVAQCPEKLNDRKVLKYPKQYGAVYLHSAGNPIQRHTLARQHAAIPNAISMSRITKHKVGK